MKQVKVQGVAKKHLSELGKLETEETEKNKIFT